MILVYITCGDTVEAKKVAEHLLDKKLIACANLSQITSMYQWEEQTKDETEVALMCKTTEDKFNAIKEEVPKVHSYDLPAIIKMPVEANEAFSQWVEKETK